MKPCKTALLIVAFTTVSAGAFAADADADAERARINAAVTAAHAAHRAAEIERHIARALSADNPREQSGGLASLKSLLLTAEEATSAYRTLLRDGSLTTRELALHHIAHHPGGAANGLREEILQIIQDSKAHANILAAAVNAAAAVSPATAQTASAVASLLDKPIPDHVALAALKALRSMGASAAATIPKIQPHLDSHNSAVQFDAFSAIGELKGAPDDKVQQAVSGGSVAGLQIEEQYGVLKSSRNKPGAKALLIKTLEDKRPYIQAAALQSLATIGNSDNAAVKAILLRTAAPDEFISRTAAEALHGIDAANVTLVQTLSEGLAHSNQRVRHSAAKALKRFGVAARPALPALVAALREAPQAESHYQVGAYLEVIRNLGPGGKDAAPAILDLLPERSPLYHNLPKFATHYLRAFMLLTLTDVGALEQAAPFILDGLANSDGSTAHFYAVAARAAARSPELWNQALPFLTRALQPDFPDHVLTFESYFARISTRGEHTSGRIEAIRALGQMGPAAKTVGAQLAKVAAQRPEFMGDASLIADEATKALRAIGN